MMCASKESNQNQQETTFFAIVHQLVGFIFCVGDNKQNNVHEMSCRICKLRLFFYDATNPCTFTVFVVDDESKASQSKDAEPDEDHTPPGLISINFQC